MRTRSRGSSLPRATCFALAASPPPSAILATRARRSSTSACMAAALARKSSLRGLSLLSMCGMRSPLFPSLFGRKISVDVEPAWRAAQARVGFAQEAADLVQPLALATDAEAGDEFDVILVGVGRLVYFTLT